MIAFAWLIAIALSVVAAAYVLAAIVAAVRALQPHLAAVSGAVGVVFVGVLFGVKNPFVVAAVAVASGVAGVFLLRRLTRNASHAGQTLKLSAAHLALLAGSFLFLIPFAWLVSTSLKPDDEMAVFPPVWIPTQQVTTPNRKNADNKPAGLSWYAAGGAPLAADETARQKVAEVANLPSGRVEVVGLSPQTLSGEAFAGRNFDAGRDELTKIRKVDPRWENYPEALAYLPADTLRGLRFLGNTLTITILTVIGTLLSSSLVAYSFARLHWPGKNLLFVVLLATMMIPGAITLMPQFLIFRSLGWIDTLRPLWVPAFFGSAFNIFLLRQFFLSIPTELEDAAKIDGCGPFAIYWRVMLPLVKPALAAIAIMGTLGAWNNFQGPLIYLSSPEKMPVAYALQLYQTQHTGEPGLLMAASTLVVLPIIVLFFFTQRYFIQGVSLTGLGGR